MKKSNNKSYGKKKVKNKVIFLFVCWVNKWNDKLSLFVAINKSLNYYKNVAIDIRHLMFFTWQIGTLRWNANFGGAILLRCNYIKWFERKRIFYATSIAVKKFYNIVTGFVYYRRKEPSRSVQARCRQAEECDKVHDRLF